MGYAVCKEKEKVLVYYRKINEKKRAKRTETETKKTTYEGLFVGVDHNFEIRTSQLLQKVVNTRALLESPTSPILKCADIFKFSSIHRII